MAHASPFRFSINYFTYLINLTNSTYPLTPCYPHTPLRRFGIGRDELII